MSRGRKRQVNVNSDWENVFYNSVATYMQIILHELGSDIKAEPISKHIKIVGGYAFKSSEYVKHGIPVIRISDFSNEEIDLTDPVFYNESDELTRYELFEGDIIIALTGGTIAKLAIVQAGLGKLYLNQRVGKFEIINKDEFEGEFVYWIARSVQSIIKNLAWGAAIPNISPKLIEELHFPIPKKDIQRGIIEYLNDLKQNIVDENKVYFNNIIEKQILTLQKKQVIGALIKDEESSQLEKITQLRQAFLREAMQGKLVPQDANDEPASVLLERIKAEKQKLIAEGKIKKEKPLPPIKPEEIPYEIPESWVWCRLGEIKTDLRYGSSVKAEYDGDVAILRMGNITLDGKIIYTNMKYVSKHIDELPELYLENGDLVFNRTNSFELVGKCGIFKNETRHTLASYLIRVRFSTNTSSQFISNYINSSICRTTQLEPNIIQQNGQANFNGTKLANIILPLPPLAEQQRIVSKLDEVMRYCDELEQNVKTSKVQTEMLLQVVLKEALARN